MTEGADGLARIRLAVFLRAIKDALAGTPKSYRANGLYPDRMDEIREAHYWLFDEPLWTPPRPFSFAAICLDLDWEPAQIRNDLIRLWRTDRERLRAIVEQFDPDDDDCDVAYSQKVPCPKQQAQSFSRQLTLF